MKRRTQLALLGATLLSLALTGGAFAASPSVTVRIEGSQKTRLLPASVRTRLGFITRFGAPSGKCPARSAQGALDVATHGHWIGTWNAQYDEYFITSILGEKPTGSNFWEIFVNNKAATLGACDLKLQPGQQLLFADESGKITPSGLSAPRRAVVGKRFTVKLVGYNAKGKAKPLAGVLITGDHGVIPTRTDRRGTATLIAPLLGKVILRAAPKGYLRTEAVVQITG